MKFQRKLSGASHHLSLTKKALSISITQVNHSQSSYQMVLILGRIPLLNIWEYRKGARPVISKGLSKGNPSTYLFDVSGWCQSDFIDFWITKRRVYLL